MDQVGTQQSITLIAQGYIFGTKDRKVDPKITAFLKDRGKEGA